MFALTLITVFAVASAGPERLFARLFNFADNVFHEDSNDSSRFWYEMKFADIEKVAAFGDIRVDIPDLIGDTEVVGNNYVIKIDAPRNRLWKMTMKSCPGFLKILVVYKVKEGFDTTNTYVDLTWLPPNVDPARAMWGYEDDVMTINFPYIESSQTTPEATDDRKGVEFMTDDGEDTNVVMTTTTEKNEEEDQYEFEAFYGKTKALLHKVENERKHDIYYDLVF